MWWHNYDAELRGYSEIGPGESVKQWTFVTHPWSATGLDDSSVDLRVGGRKVFVPE